jgi:hypothetical protein
LNYSTEAGEKEVQIILYEAGKPDDIIENITYHIFVVANK